MDIVKKWAGHIATIIAFFAAAISAGAAIVAPGQTNYIDGEVLVRFRAGETTNTVQEIAARHGCTVKIHYRELSKHEGQIINLLSSTKSTAALLTELQGDPAVEEAEPNYLRSFNALRTPNDPKFNQQWSFQNVGQKLQGVIGASNVDVSFLKAWGLARPSTNEIVVGVIDSGLDITHPDILPNLWVNPAENGTNHLDDDVNGYVDDVNGYDFMLHTNVMTDSGFHGTHVAGTVAAVGNNAKGVIGVDFQAHIMALKVSTNGENFSTAAVIEAADYATMMKYRGVNLVALNASYGGPNFSSAERASIAAAGDAGIVFCAAAGNSTNNNDTLPFYPANYRLANEIVIAATDQNDALAIFSNYGATTVDMGAPGVNILSLAPVNQLTLQSAVFQSTNNYFARAMTFSGTTTSNGITAPMYYCGSGASNEFPSGVHDFIALIQRGGSNFSVKTTNAMAAGALAAIIFNNSSGMFNGTLSIPSTNWIPTVSMSREDGLVLANLPGIGLGQVSATVVSFLDPTNIYQYLDGTSMATPHVSAAVAFAALNFPNETMAQRIQRILTNGTPIPSLAGKTVTGSRLNLARIVDTDSNGLPDWWEQQYFGQLAGVSTNADTDYDGENNLAEFLAGTVPTNSMSVLAMASRFSQPGKFNLQWPSASGRYYRILRGTNLVTGFTTVLQTNLAATPPVNLFTDSPPASLKAAFYQLQVEP